MKWNKEDKYIICGAGYQTETIIMFCKLKGITLDCVLTDVFSKSPDKCYLIPSKRGGTRNSFSELDMMMDSKIEDVSVKRFDMLSLEEIKSVFVYYESPESINAFHTIEKDCNVKYYMLSDEDIKGINTLVWDNNALVSELWKTNQYLYSEMEIMKNCMRRQLKATIYDFHFEFHLVEHCNLQCAGCTHFSSVAAEEFADIEEFRRDINRLSELTGGHTRFINLLGGEPLLHPQICDFIHVARTGFPHTLIRIVTNGIKLLEMPEEFWESCRKNNIVIGVTQYPIGVDYERCLQRMEEQSIKFESFSGEDLPRDEMWRLSLNENRLSRPVENFIRCPRANACIFVSHGKIFNCATMANVGHLNKCFCTHFELLEADYVDIYKCKDIDEVLLKLCNPKPFCRYCNIDARRYGVKWKRTSYDRSEWGM